MSESISTILIYSEQEEFVESSLMSLALQSTPTSEIIVGDLHARANFEKLADKTGIPKFRIVSRQIDGEKTESVTDFIRRLYDETTGTHIFFSPAHHLVAPTFLESVGEHFSAHSSCKIVLSNVRLVGQLERFVPTSLNELIFFPDRFCFAVYRRDSFEEVKNDLPQSLDLLHATLVLRLLQKEPASVSVLKQPLFLQRITNGVRFNPAERLQSAIDRKGLRAEFASIFDDSEMKAHLDELEDEYLQYLHMQAQEITNLKETLAAKTSEYKNAVDDYSDLRKKYLDLVKLHNDALASVQVTANHLVSALKRKVFSSK